MPEPPLVSLLPFVRPWPNNPAMCFGPNPFALDHEIGHALQFLKISDSTRERILHNYIPFVLGITNGPYHNIPRDTNEFVAFLEAFGFFAESYYQSKRALGAPPPGSAPATFHTHFYGYLRQQIHSHWNVHPPIPPPPATLPAPAPGEEAWSRRSPATIEGAICVALFVDYAEKIGLPFVVETFVNSNALTFAEYANWIARQHSRFSREYTDLQAAVSPWGISMPAPALSRTNYTLYLRAPIKNAAGVDAGTIAEAPAARIPRKLILAHKASRSACRGRPAATRASRSHRSSTAGSRSCRATASDPPRCRPRPAARNAPISPAGAGIPWAQSCSPPSVRTRPRL